MTIDLTRYQKYWHDQLENKPVYFWTCEQGIGKHVILISLLTKHTQPMYVCGPHMTGFMRSQLKNYGYGPEDVTVCTPQSLPSTIPNYLVVDMPGVSRSALQINSTLSMLALQLVIAGDPILYIN